MVAKSVFRPFQPRRNAKKIVYSPNDNPSNDHADDDDIPELEGVSDADINDLNHDENEENDGDVDDRHNDDNDDKDDGADFVDVDYDAELPDDDGVNELAGLSAEEVTKFLVETKLP